MAIESEGGGSCCIFEDGEEAQRDARKWEAGRTEQLEQWRESWAAPGPRGTCPDLQEVSEGTPSSALPTGKSLKGKVKEAFSPDPGQFSFLKHLLYVLRLYLRNRL